MEEVKLEAVQDNNVELVTEILGDISSLKVKDDSADELSRILQEPHFQVSAETWLLAVTVLGMILLYGVIKFHLTLFLNRFHPVTPHTVPNDND